jgi:hypothetical protein
MAPKKAKLPVSKPVTPKPRNARAKKAVDSGANPQTLSLSENERLQVRAYLAEYKRHNAEATLKLIEKQALQRQLDPDNKLGVLDQAIRAASQEAARAQEQHNEVLASIEKRLNISIKDFSFDPDTGRLMPHAAPKEE